jgi:DNA replication protein DnaC
LVKLNTNPENTHILRIEEPTWKKCAQCPNEVSSGSLNEHGVCPMCVFSNTAAGKMEKQREAFESEIVNFVGGKKAYDLFRMDLFKPSPGTVAAFNAVKNFNPDTDNMFLYGPAGVGKTHLAYAAARRFIAFEGVQAYVEKVPRLMRWFRLRDPRDQDAELKRLSTVKVLVLDDLGVEKDTETALGILYEIIDQRDMNRRNGLIITSNLDPEGLARKMHDDRLPSRIFGLCTVIKMAGDDMRVAR